MIIKARIFLIIIFISLLSCEEDEKTIAPNSVEGYFEKIWNDYDQTYSYFDIKGVDWDSVYAVNRPLIVNGTTDFTDLEEIVASMTLALKDLHVKFEANGKVYQFKNRDKFKANSPINAQNYLETNFTNTATVLYGDIDGRSITYLRVKTLSSQGDYQPLERVLTDLSEKDGLIFDLRDNGGGNDAIAQEIVSRLTTEPRVFELVRFRNGPNHNDFGEWFERELNPVNPVLFDKPIVVLINRGVISSAETFTLMLKSLPNTLFIGDTTRGSSANPEEYKLPIGWSYRVSRWQAATPDQRIIEDQGIPPDVVVHNTKESELAGRDLILERAIEQF